MAERARDGGSTPGSLSGPPGGHAARGTRSTSPGRSLAQRLPDLPRWVEARDLLWTGDGEILGLQEGPEISLVVRDPASELVAVIGDPAEAAVHEAVRRNARGGTVIAPPERRAMLARALPRWTGTRAILHLLAEPSRLPEPAPGQVRFLEPGALDGLRVPAELLRELRTAAGRSPIAATLVGEEPVSFCYASGVTESLWDISIDTLPEHRRRGYAALCVSYMIRHMGELGKRPVWGAVEENPASWRLARTLGFVPVDELALFEPDPATPRASDTEG